MNALRLPLVPKVLPVAIYAMRHALCLVFPHLYRPLGQNQDEGWLDGNVRPGTEIVICRRCLQVKRRPIHAGRKGHP